MADSWKQIVSETTSELGDVMKTSVKESWQRARVHFARMFTGVLICMVSAIIADILFQYLKIQNNFPHMVVEGVGLIFVLVWLVGAVFMLWGYAGYMLGGFFQKKV